MTATSALAQLVIDLPAAPLTGELAEVSSRGPQSRAGSPDRKSRRPHQASPTMRGPVNTLTIESSRGDPMLPWSEHATPVFTDVRRPEHYIAIAAEPVPATLGLSAFGGGANDGSVRGGSTWAGNVTQGPNYVMVAGSAKDDNGWGATGLALNASAMNYITITAQRNAGNASGTLFLQLEDRSLNTSVFSISTSAFAPGAATQAQIVIGAWPTGFDATQIGGWSIGGGGVGTFDFRMTFFDLGFSTTSLSAVPEPSVVALALGVASLTTASWCRRRRLPAPKKGNANPR